MVDQKAESMDLKTVAKTADLKADDSVDQKDPTTVEHLAVHLAGLMAVHSAGLMAYEMVAMRVVLRVVLLDLMTADDSVDQKAESMAGRLAVHLACMMAQHSVGLKATEMVETMADQMVV